MSQGTFILNLDKLQQCMASTIKSIENMGIQIHGNIAHKCLTIYLLVQSLITRFSVSMEGSVLKLKPLIKSEL